MPALLRSILAFLALPGIVAIAIPLAYACTREFPPHLAFIGLLPLITGLAGLIWCARDFHVSGHGTLAPWMPTDRLVSVGLYQYTRNPMYISVVVMLIGWAILFSSTALAIYAVIVALAFHIRVVFGEEPLLARTYGDHWQIYAQRVPRWLLPQFRRKH